MPVHPTSHDARRPSRVVNRSLAELSTLLGVEVGDSARHVSVTGVAQAADRIVPGDLYVARPGVRTHGAAFASEAAGAGSVAALTDTAGIQRCTAAGLPTVVVDDPQAVLGTVSAWVYGEPARDLTMLGVTGTNGKTTTTYLLDAALRGADRTTGLVGTVETRVGEHVVPSVRTTPEATDLHALLAVMREDRVDAVSLEVSSHALALGRVDGVTFDVVGFTNLSQDHLEIHGDMQSYYRAKASLFEPQRARAGVINVDDASGARLAGEVTIPVVTISPSGREGAAWRARQVVEDPTGWLRFEIVDPDGETVPCRLRMVGGYNVANALMAIAMLAQIGIDPRAAADAIAGAAVPGRMERVAITPTGRTDQDGPTTTQAGEVTVLVDYAHTPDAITGALAAARVPTIGRVIAVVGCGGDRDIQKRPRMGSAAAAGADVVVITDDNPRSEDPGEIRAAALRGARDVAAPEAGELVEIGDRREAIRWAVQHARAGDTVVVLGKGHEQGQEVAGVVHPFDDRLVAHEALLARRTLASETTGDHP